MTNGLLPPRKSNDPAVQRWAIAFAAYERGRKAYTDAILEMEHESAATLQAVRDAGGQLEVELLDGTRLRLEVHKGALPGDTYVAGKVLA